MSTPEEPAIIQASQTPASVTQKQSLTPPGSSTNVQKESVAVMTEPPTLYSAGMVGNPANSGELRSTNRREDVGSLPFSADNDTVARPETSHRSPSPDDEEEVVSGATPTEKRHYTTASHLDNVDRDVQHPPVDPLGNPGSDDAPAATCGTNATSESLAECPRSATTGLDIDSDRRTISNITVIVLTGGGSTRFGEDKASTQVAGSTMLGHILADIHPSIPVVVVGPVPAQVLQLNSESRSSFVTREQESEPEALSRSLLVTREDPPGGGPVAGVLAGLKLVKTPVCCVIATDMPTSTAIALGLAAEHVRQFRLSSTLVARVQTENSRAHIGTVGSGGAALGQSSADAVGHTQPACDGPPESTVPDALIPLDAAGHAQPLCASYSTAALRRVAATLGSGNGAPFRDLLGLLRVREVQLETNEQPKLFDIDTRADLARSRQAIMNHVGGQNSLSKTGGTEMLNDWAAAAASELDLDTEVDVEVILDVAKEAAHGVARPAAPLTTFLLGYAVAKGADLQEAAAKLNTLAETWSKDQD